MRVRDVMRKKVRTISPTEPVSAAREMLRRFDIRHLVVLEHKSVVGVIADRDLFEVSADTAVRKAMVRPVTIAPDETVRKAAALMTGHVIGSLPVVDDGNLVGIVTTYDLVSLLAKGATRGTRRNPAARAR